MKYYVFCWIIFFVSCSSSGVYLNSKRYKIDNPPNMVKISDNFFADKTEITNADYREYLFDLTQMYGADSPQFLAAHPDTTVWREFVSYGEPYRDNYFSHPSYDNYPVVGINLEQARKFSEWRTERVAEMFLINRGLIKIVSGRTAADRFTIARYGEGGYDWIIRQQLVAIPVFKIPTVEEWEKIAGVDSAFKYGVNKETGPNKRMLKRTGNLFNTKDNPQTGSFHTPGPTSGTAKNVYGLYHIIGNVAEIVNQPNTAKGGSWRQELKEIQIDNHQVFEKPNCWVGFRNVATFRTIDEEW